MHEQHIGKTQVDLQCETVQHVYIIVQKIVLILGRLKQLEGTSKNASIRLQTGCCTDLC